MLRGFFLFEACFRSLFIYQRVSFRDTVTVKNYEEHWLLLVIGILNVTRGHWTRHV